MQLTGAWGWRRRVASLHGARSRANRPPMSKSKQRRLSQIRHSRSAKLAIQAATTAPCVIQLMLAVGRVSVARQIRLGTHARHMSLSQLSLRSVSVQSPTSLALTVKQTTTLLRGDDDCCAYHRSFHIELILHATAAVPPWPRYDWSSFVR